MSSFCYRQPYGRPCGPADCDSRIVGADGSVRWTGLTGCAPHCDVLHVVLESARRRAAFPAWVPGLRNEAVLGRVISQMRDKARGVAVAVAIPIARTRAKF